MSKSNDLTGKRFGKLVVIKRVGSDKHGRIKWLCRCDCGNEHVTLGTILKRGQAQSCGCSRHPSLLGKRFGNLVVIGKTEKQYHRNHVWLCQCDCGKTIEVPTKNLTSGNTKSCGCLRRSDFTGRRFGKLTVEAFAGYNERGERLWDCICCCGNRSKVKSFDLMSGHVTSCGCSKGCTTHGMSKTRLYKQWSGMRSRCENPHNGAYKNYGARGISVCDEWQDFETFRKWAVENGYDEKSPKGTFTIDRIDPEKGYSPENCRWLTISEQQWNKRGTATIRYQEKELTVREASKLSGVPEETIRSRMKRNWSPKRIIEQPVRERSKNA